MSPQQVTLQVNGVAHEISVAPDAILLDVLHDQLGMKDVRYGCGRGCAAPARCCSRARP